MNKSVKNELPPFRPILSAVSTSKFKLGKFLLPILSDITLNEFNVKDSFIFFDEILTQNNDLHMDSLDVDALFTNIPLEQTINIWVEKLFETQDTLVKRISKKDICDLLNLATKQSFVTFNNKFHIKIDSVAMGTPPGPIMAHIFVSHHEKTGCINVPLNLNQLFVEFILIIFLDFMNHLNLSTRFTNISPLNMRG